jgi:hypothetical protein
MHTGYIALFSSVHIHATTIQGRIEIGRVTATLPRNDDVPHHGAKRGTIHQSLTGRARRRACAAGAQARWNGGGARRVRGTVPGSGDGTEPDAAMAHKESGCGGHEPTRTVDSGRGARAHVRGAGRGGMARRVGV